MMSDLAPRLDLALRAAREAGSLILRHYHGGQCIPESKHDGTPVTIADREAEQLIRAMIAASFPDDRILGEEFGEDVAQARGLNRGRWIIDPIDGTFSFIHGMPFFGTLIAYEIDGIAQLGVIHHPALAHTVYAMRGGGTWEVLGDTPPRRVRVSDAADPAKATFVTTSPRYFIDNARWPAYQRLHHAFGQSRGANDCYALTLVATGRADACVEPWLGGVWDIAAAQPIIEEAGGRLTDWRGLNTIHKPEAVVTNALLHDHTLNLLRDP